MAEGVRRSATALRPVVVGVRLSRREAAALDVQRGGLSRSAFLRHLLAVHSGGARTTS